MPYICRRDKNGCIVSAGWMRTMPEAQEGLEEISKEELEQWESEMMVLPEPEGPEMPGPSAMEQLRADVDYLAALQGVTL